MRIASITPVLVSALLLVPASRASAVRVAPVAATTNMGSGFGTSLQNTINGNGLSSPTLTASHAATVPANSWVSNLLVTGQVTFDLGGSFRLVGFSFWNQNGGGPGLSGVTGIRAVNVLFSNDGTTFVPLPGAPSTFAQVPSMGAGPETFSFATVTATHVRFQIVSNWGDSQTGFAEVAFDGTSTATTPIVKTAVYDAALKAPRCGATATACDSGTLLVGRDTIMSGPEPNQPNTINNSCPDGSQGLFHSDESIDRVTISTVDGGRFAPGKQVRIATTVWNFGGDFLDLYYAANALSPSWTYLTTLTPSAAAGLQTLSATYTLPAGGLQAVRAAFRFLGSPSACTIGPFDDRDDLIFALSTPADFDGDAKADPTVFRPSTGGWFALNSGTNFTTSSAFSWGLSTDVPVPADYDGDGKTDPAIFRPSTGLWAVLLSGANYTTSLSVAWGLSTDVPVPGDFDGDGKADPAVYRPSTGGWFFLKSTTNFTTSGSVSWGLSTDLPVQGDYDGDGKTDPAIFRPSTGLWAALLSSTDYTTSLTKSWGLSTDVAVPGDYDGDGKTDPAVFRPSTGGWFFLFSGTNYTTSGGVAWGLSTDVPVPADFDGDGKTDPAIFRPSTGLWAVLKSSATYTSSLNVAWGLSTDTPINKRP